MKTLALTLAAALLGTSVPVLADGATYRYPQALTSELTRAQVQAETIAAVAGGEISRGEQSYVAPASRRLTLTRSQVRAELAKARVHGELSSGERVFVPEFQARSGGATQLARLNVQ